MKLIVLSYHFPPDPSIGARRWAGLSKYLARSGAEIHVVASGSQDSVELPGTGVSVHRVARRRTLNDLYRTMVGRRKNTGGSSEHGGNPATAGPGVGVHAAIRRELSVMLSFPDESRGWGMKAIGATRRIARAGGVTAVVSSGPPHMTHLVGGVVASWYGLPHVIDLRDPWATYRSDLRVWPGIHTSRLGRFALPKLERLAFRRSSMIIANTRKLQELLRGQYPTGRIEWVPNGVDIEETDGPGACAPYPGLSVAYTGTLYAGRTLDGVMEALAAFLHRHPEAREAGSCLRVAGPMEATHAESFWSKCRQLQLEGVVEHLGVLPRTRADELVRASSLCLVLAQEQHLQVPGKIYELAAMGCPTLVISETDSASAEEAARLGVQLSPDDPDSLLRVFERVWSGDQSTRVNGSPLLSYEDIAVAMERIILETQRRRPARNAR